MPRTTTHKDLFLTGFFLQGPSLRSLSGVDAMHKLIDAYKSALAGAMSSIAFNLGLRLGHDDSESLCGSA
jgi:hypothetical protein